MKKRIREALNRIEPKDFFKDIWDHVHSIDAVMFQREINAGLIRIEEGSDSYVMGVYFSKKLGKSLIIDWDFREQYESLDELVDAIVSIEKDGTAMETALEYSQERYYQMIKQQHQTKNKEQSQEHER